MNTELSSTRGASFGPTLVAGFGATLAAATVWFITHLPWLGLMEQIAIPLVLVAWFLVIAGVAANVRKVRSLGVGIGAGLLSGLAGLVFFGTRLGKAANETGVSEGVVPNAALMALGFVVLGVVIGAVAGVIGRVIARDRTIDAPATHWLARFALVSALAIAPLVFVGGLVTSTKSGLAVPDWPRTFGANMFLYPLGSHTDPGAFVEHAHRLFGAFAGLCVIVLTVFTFAADARRWVRILAVVALVLVCIQGILGGVRVEAKSVALALVHGVLAQLTLGTVVGLATVLTDRFRALPPAQVNVDPNVARRTKFFCTGVLHSTILQLFFGALYRHIGGGHALLTHIGFSVVVTIVAAIAGFMLMHPAIRRTPLAKPASTVGLSLAIVACLQFVLGWVALMARSHADPANPLQSVSFGAALLRTAHQANGALLLSLATMAFVWGKRLGRAGRATAVSGAAVPATP